MGRVEDPETKQDEEKPSDEVKSCTEPMEIITEEQMLKLDEMIEKSGCNLKNKFNKFKPISTVKKKKKSVKTVRYKLRKNIHEKISDMILNCQVRLKQYDYDQLTVLLLHCANVVKKNMRYSKNLIKSNELGNFDDSDHEEYASKTDEDAVVTTVDVNDIVFEENETVIPSTEADIMAGDMQIEKKIIIPTLKIICGHTDDTQYYACRKCYNAKCSSCIKLHDCKQRRFRCDNELCEVYNRCVTEYIIDFSTVCALCEDGTKYTAVYFAENANCCHHVCVSCFNKRYSSKSVAGRYNCRCCSKRTRFVRISKY